MRKKIVIVLISMVVVAAVVFRQEIQLAFYFTAKTDNKTDVEFFISKRMNLEDLASSLEIVGVVDSKKALMALGEYKHLNKDNIALGKYTISPKMPLRNLLNGFKINSLGNGNAEEEVNVVLPNVRFVEDLVGNLSRQLLLDSTELMMELTSQEFLTANNLTKESMPSIFLPNTYKYFYDTDAKQFLARMMREYNAFWTTERLNSLSEAGLRTRGEAATLASIVYSEQSKLPAEWPIIAGLYLNRIRKGIPLQSDPTFKFCWGKELDTVQRLLSIHRNIDCAYNTYQIQGLPPGPICIPPIEVVAAVLKPAQHAYLYMVAKPTYSGEHFFSTNYEDHLRNAKVFQKWLGKELANNQ